MNNLRNLFKEKSDLFFLELIYKLFTVNLKNCFAQWSLNV